jgi:hypothetical protein
MAKASDEYTQAEATRRRDDLLKRMLGTPPKPHAEMKKHRREAKPRTQAKTKKA